MIRVRPYIRLVRILQVGGGRLSLSCANGKQGTYRPPDGTMGHMLDIADLDSATGEELRASWLVLQTDPRPQGREVSSTSVLLVSAVVRLIQFGTRATRWGVHACKREAASLRLGAGHHDRDNSRERRKTRKD